MSRVQESVSVPATSVQVPLWQVGVLEVRVRLPVSSHIPLSYVQAPKVP